MRHENMFKVWAACLAGAVGCSPADKQPAGDAGTSQADTAASGGDAGSGGDGSDGSDGGGSGTGGDSAEDSGEEIDWDSLNGFVPDPAGVLPDFVAYHHDTSPRSREDLLGDPTVMWFYPAAATSG